MSFECIIERAFVGPAERIFEAWTDPDLFAKWVWAGIGTEPRAEIDLRIGGLFRASTKVKEERWAFRGTWTAIEPPHRLAGVLVWEADVGYPPGDEPLEITLVPTEDGCRMRFVHRGIPDEKSVEGHRAGWSKAFDDLAGVLA